MSGRAGRARSGVGGRHRVAGPALVAALLVGVPLPAAAEAADAPGPQCRVTDPRLAELSGLAVVGDRMLAVVDGGDEVAVYVLDGACSVLDVHTVPIDPYDPEDMAVAGDGTVWIADTGDNQGTRTTVALLALRPDGTTGLYRLAYPDGPRDVEALLLAPDGTPYLVSKEVLGASSVFRPVSDLVDAGTVGLTEVAGVEFTLTGTPGGPVGRAGQLMVTGGAVSPDGRRVALRTYTDAYVWSLSGSDVVGALAADPVRIPLPASPQGEAIAFTADGGSLVVAGEGMPSQVSTVPVPGTSAPAPSEEPAGVPAADEGTSRAGDDVPAGAAAVVAAVAAAVIVWLAGRLRRRG